MSEEAKEIVGYQAGDRIVSAVRNDERVPEQTSKLAFTDTLLRRRDFAVFTIYLQSQTKGFGLYTLRPVFLNLSYPNISELNITFSIVSSVLNMTK